MIKIICICIVFVVGGVLSAPFDSLSTTTATTTTTTEHPYAYIPKIINTTRLYRPSPINPDVISDPKPDDKITFIDPTKPDNIQHIVSKRNSDVKVIPSLYASERQHTIENVQAENVQKTEHSKENHSNDRSKENHSDDRTNENHSNDRSKENHSNDRSKENHSNDRSKENHSNDRSKENHSNEHTKENHTNDEHKSNEHHSVENQKRTPFRRGNVHNTIPSTYAQPAVLLRHDQNEKSEHNDNIKNDESHATSIKHKREVAPQNEKPIFGKQNLKPKDVQPQQLEQKPLATSDTELNNKRELPPSENDKTKQSQVAKAPITSASPIIKTKSPATNTKRSTPIADETLKSSSDIKSDTPIITALKESNENKQSIRNINFNYNHEKTIEKRETSHKGDGDGEGERKKLTYDDQDDIDDNKPPTLVYPVPVNQIIKHGSAAPVKHAHHNLETNNDAADSNDADEKKKETNQSIGNNKSNGKTTAKVDLHKSTNTEDS